MTTLRRRRSAISAAAEGDATGVQSVDAQQHFTEPPPRYNRGQPDQGPRRARHRPALHVRGHDFHIVDRGYVKVKERRLHPNRSARL